MLQTGVFSIVQGNINIDVDLTTRSRPLLDRTLINRISPGKERRKYPFETWRFNKIPLPRFPPIRLDSNEICSIDREELNSIVLLAHTSRSAMTSNARYVQVSRVHIKNWNFNTFGFSLFETRGALIELFSKAIFSFRFSVADCGEDSKVFLFFFLFFLSVKFRRGDSFQNADVQ